MAEKINIAKEALDNNNPLTSDLVKDIIDNNNSEPINKDVKDTDVQPVVEVKEEPSQEPQPTLKSNIKDLETQLLQQVNPIDKNDTPVDFQQSIEAIRKQYEDLAKKQKQEYENEVAKIQLQLEKQKQKEVMAGMTETEKERYALNLKIKELQETINVFETRNKDLEARLEKQNNEKYISDRIQEYPYIKDFVNKLNVQTKAEYESKILPILGQIKDLQDLKSQNQMYGNKNAFAGYGNQGLKEDSDVRKKIDSYSQDFIKGLIKK